MFIRSTIFLVAFCAVIVRGSLRGAPIQERKLQETPTSGIELSRFYRDAINEDGVMSHLQALQDIADKNHGNRASGTTGWLDTAKYIAGQLEDAGYFVQFHELMVPHFEELTPTVFSVEESAVEIPAELYENAGNETSYFTSGGNGIAEGYVRSVNHTFHSGNESISTSGCDEEDFADFQPGEIALIQRGTCFFVTKIGLAVNASASAVIIFNEGNTDDRKEALDYRFGMNDVPVLFASHDLGLAMANAVEQGPLKIKIRVNSIIEDRMQKNIIVETDNGNASQVLMVGAHTDSVPAGPGINDDGSGTAGILEMAIQLKKLGLDNPDTLKNKIRFGWWASEEIGLLGSEAYVADLSEEEINDIAMYINLDMIASPNFVRFVIDGNNSTERADVPDLHPGMDHIEMIMHQYFNEMDIPIEQQSFADGYGRTDHAPFYEVGIPVTGLFTGAEMIKTEEQAAIFGGEAGVAYDACYHMACDDINNLDKTVMVEFTQAAAHTLAMYGSKEGDLFVEDPIAYGTGVAVEKRMIDIPFDP